jgi:hypothetical protein
VRLRVGATDFDDRHVGAVCVLLQVSLPVRLNMNEPNNGQALSATQDNRPRRRAFVASVAYVAA